MRKSRGKNLRGFTLVELIVTILIIAVFGAMLVQIMGTSLTKSSLPIVGLQTAYSLQQVMENFVTAYEKYYAGDLPGLQASIAGGVLSPPGNEGATLNNTYGQYTIVVNHFIKFDGSNHETAAGPTDSQSLLKVTIKNKNNETLTYIFSG